MAQHCVYLSVLGFFGASVSVFWDLYDFRVSRGCLYSSCLLFFFLGPARSAILNELVCYLTFRIFYPNFVVGCWTLHIMKSCRFTDKSLHFQFEKIPLLRGGELEGAEEGDVYAASCRASRSVTNSSIL